MFTHACGKMLGCFADITGITACTCKLVYKSYKYDMRNAEAILAKGRFRTDFLKFSVFNRIVNLWNGLPVAIRTIDRLSLFRKKVNQFYISKFNLSIVS